MQIRKPKVLVDIKNRRVSAFSSVRPILNLHKGDIFEINKKPIAIGLIASIAFMLLFGFAAAPTHLEQSFAAQDSASQRAALEQELKELEEQMAEYEKTISAYRQQGSTLKSEISTLEAKINKINLQIKSVSLSLEKLSGEIEQNEARILTTEEKISLHRKAISDALQNVYEIEDVSLVAILLQSPNLSGFFSNINSLLEVQTSLLAAVEQVSQLKDQLLTEKEELALKRQDAIAFKEYQDRQRRAIAEAKQEKDQLLVTTKGQEAKYQELLKETQKTAAEIRNRLFELLGGGQMTFSQAYDLAKLAGSVTGVRPSLILAVLDRESALGRNVGQCSYESAMHPKRDIPHFLEITKKLGIDPTSVKVSCAIVAHGAYGGAMGPAQFIPSTWVIYEDAIAKATGSSPANPWSNRDAFVATALYLKDALNSSACLNYAEENKNILPYQTLQERCAAARYYAGGNWYKFRFIYGDPVVEKARSFEKDIAVLSA